MREREEQENFITKKFNKLRKDLVYGPIKDLPDKIRTKGHLREVEQVRKH